MRAIKSSTGNAYSLLPGHGITMPLLLLFLTALAFGDIGPQGMNNDSTGSVLIAPSKLSFHPQIQSIIDHPLVKTVDLQDIESSVQTPFYGLAKFYNTLSYFQYDSESLVEVSATDTIGLDENNCLLISGRFHVWYLISDSTRTFMVPTLVGDSTYTSLDGLSVFRIRKSELPGISPLMAGLRYNHLWTWLTKMSLGVEWLIIGIKRISGIPWGWTIILFSLLVGLITMPLGHLRKRLQTGVDTIQTRIEPALKSIKQEFDGQEAHEKIMDVYKVNNISPLFTIKPLFIPLLQAPILISIFAALGEMPQLNGTEFLWIKDLSRPDALASLPLTIPLLGRDFNLLPWIMSAVTVVSAIIYTNPVASPESLRKQKYNLYYLAAGFFILFYPFPAALIIFWTGINTFQMLQYIKFRR